MRGLIQRLNFLWRLVATAVSFLAFGVGGLLLGLIAFPLINLFVRNPARRKRWGRSLVRTAFRTHVGIMHRLGVMTYEIRNPERLRRKGLLILANHPTLVDVVLLIAQVDDADCVVKSKLARNPVMSGPVKAAGYIFNDHGPDLIDECIASVRQGHNLVIFPEGTRTRRGEPLQLQRGAANVAVRGRLNVTPVHIRCEPMTLGKGDRWYAIPHQKFHVLLSVQPDIAIDPFALEGQGEAIQARKFTEYLTHYFSLRV